MIFLGIYSLLMIPLFLAALHVAFTNNQLSQKLLAHAGAFDFEPQTLGNTFIPSIFAGGNVFKALNHAG